jgi:hypothetical protein
MTMHEFAAMLDGRDEGKEITHREEKQAKELGFVVVFGYSDDNVEFRGAIDDEVGSFNGTEIYLDRDGIFEECEDECKYSKAAKTKCTTIDAIWCDGEGYAWTYETVIPHATFDILDEEGNKWCRGIVFDIKSLK